MSIPLVDYANYAALYDAHTLGVAGDVDFYRALALEANGLVVELGVGTGRIAVPAAAAGARILGVDLSAGMLGIAREKARAAGLARRLGLARGDMRSFALRRPVDLVTIPFRTFLHNTTTEDQLATLAAAHAALRSGGRLALNVFNPDVTLIADGLRRGDAWRTARGALEAHEQTRYAPTSQLGRTTFRFARPGGAPVRFSFTLRYVYRYEMEHLLSRSGFAIEALYGDHFRAPFDETSTEMVWIAHRA